MTNAVNGVYNIGNDYEIFILELASVIMEKIGKEPQFDFLPAREGDHLRCCPDLSKIQKIIGRQSYIGLEQGIDMML